MPFTPTHVVAILPLWPLRHWLPIPALAIGAMVPDIGLFFPIIDYAQAHSLLGVFTTCLPLGLAIFILFEFVMRRPLVALLPIWFQRRLHRLPQVPNSPRPETSLFFFAGLAIAVVAGALTHQIWDAFTHRGRWGTELVPSLNDTVGIGGYTVHGYKLFQYGSSFVGLPLLAALTMISLRYVRPNDVATTTIPLKHRLQATFVVGMIPVFIAAHAFATELSWYHALGVTITRSGAVCIVLLTVYCVGFQAVARMGAMKKQ